MTPTEKHRETADELVAAINGTSDRDGQVRAAMEFIANAERVGMEAERKRCVEIARFYPYTAIFSYHKNSAVACNASQNIADMIEGRLDASHVSQAGEA